MANKFKSRGQMILVILLVMAVGLTIGLSVASRSVTDVSFSTKIEDSSRAFSAAETGIEEVLRQGIYAAPTNIPGPTAVPGSAGATYNVDLVSYGNIRNYSLPDLTENGDGQTIWLTSFDPATGLPDTTNTVRYNYPANRWLSVCWSKEAGTSVIPALEVSLFFSDPGGGIDDIKVTRLAFDPLPSSRSAPNGFLTGNPPIGPNGSCGTTYDYRINIIPYCQPPGCVGPTPMTPNPQNQNSILIAMRLKPIYAPALLAVRGDCAPALGPCPGTGEILLPEQGKNITSSGQTTSGVTRKWNVVQTYSSAPDIFDYAVWSDTNLTK